MYGTLIDWETGVYEAFAKEAERDGFELDRDVLIPLFHEIEREIEAGSYELYAEVLRRTAVEIAKRLDWDLEPSRSGFLPDSVQRWKPFRETNPQLAKLAKKYKLGLLSNIDDKLLGQTRRHIPHRLRSRRHRPAGPLLQARPGPLHRVRAAHRRQAGLGARRRQLLPRRGAVHESAGPRDLGQPPQREARLLPEEADRRGAEPQRGGQAARRQPESTVRAQALDEDVLLVTSAVLALNCVVVRAALQEPAEAGGLRDRLAGAPRRARRAARPARAGRLPGPAGCWPPTATGTTCSAGWPSRAALGCAESTAARLTAAPGEAQRELRDFDEELMIERPAPLALGSLAGAAGARPLRHRRPRARAAPGRRPHRRTAWRC